LYCALPVDWHPTSVTRAANDKPLSKRDFMAFHPVLNCEQAAHRRRGAYVCRTVLAVHWQHSVELAIGTSTDGSVCPLSAQSGL
jgi:hypothetical protein